MVDTQKYQKMEAIEELLDDYDLIIAGLEANIALRNLRIQTLESKLKMDKPANVKVIGYKRLLGFKKEAHFNELKKITYQQYQDGLREKLNNIKRGKE